MKKYGSLNSSGSNNSSSFGGGLVFQSFKKVKKEDWPVVSARVHPEIRRILMRMYPKRGELSNAIYKLLEDHVLKPS